MDRAKGLMVEHRDLKLMEIAVHTAKAKVERARDENHPNFYRMYDEYCLMRDQYNAMKEFLADA